VYLHNVFVVKHIPDFVAKRTTLIPRQPPVSMNTVVHTGGWRGQSVVRFATTSSICFTTKTLFKYTWHRERISRKLCLKHVRLWFCNNKTLNLSTMSFHRSVTSNYNPRCVWFMRLNMKYTAHLSNRSQVSL